MTATTTKRYLQGKEARKWADQMKRDKEAQEQKNAVDYKQANGSNRQDHQE